MTRWIAATIVLAGCNALVAAAPSTIADVACVLVDAEKKAPIAQIVIDCGGDTAQVIAILADPANYSKVGSSKAYAEMQSVKNTLQK